MVAFVWVEQHASVVREVNGLVLIVPKVNTYLKSLFLSFVEFS